MRFVKCVLIGAIIGLLIGLVFALGIAGFSCIHIIKGCEECGRYGCDSCNDGCKSCVGGVLSGTCGFIEGCASCSDCMSSCGVSCASSCIDGCKNGRYDCAGFKECGFACEECGWAWESCGKGCKTDTSITYNKINNNYKAKNFLIYFIIIGTSIGMVFAFVCDMQEKIARKREAEYIERKRKEEKERIEKKSKQMAEVKWQEMKDWLSN